MYTQDMLDELEKAIASGALEIQYQGRRIIYRSLEEMLRIRDSMKTKLEGSSRKSRRYLAKYNSGL